jgi:membrane fusion protein (multidrug efflux system)
MTSTILERKTGTAAQPQRLRRPRLAILGTALALLLGAAVYGEHWWTVGRFIQSTDDAYVGGNITPLAPHVDAFIAEIPVTDNQFVHRGDFLIRLDPRDYETARDHAQAVLSSRVAAADALRAQLALQQATIRQQEASLSGKIAAATFAETDATRYRILAQTSAASRENAERTQSQQQQTKADVTATEAGIEAARQQLKVLSADIAEADAAVAQARSDLRTAELNLGYTEIRSPIDGYVGNRAAQVGAFAKAGGYLISVTPATGLWVDANFKEDQLTQMVPGQSVAVHADVLPGHIFHGHVISLTPGTGAVFSVIPPENATGNFIKIVQRVPVRIALDPGDAALPMLRPGLSTTVDVDTRDGKAAE